MMKDKVRTFGGRVEELSPRGIGAVFGVQPTEDAPRRAAHAAMAIQKAVERAGTQDGHDGAIKIGIHVDQVLVGSSASGSEVDSDGREPNGRCSTRCWRRSRAGTSWYLRRPSRSWSGASLFAGGHREGRPYTLGSREARGSDPAAGCRPSSAGARNCNCSEGASNPRAVATARSLRLSERRGSASLAYCMSSAKVCAGSASRTWKGIASRTPPASRISPSTGSCGAPVAWPTPILRKRWSERSAPASTG